MIDLSPLDVRKKKGDFRKVMRGYDPESVDSFLDEVAARLEQLVREHATLSSRVAGMADAIAEYRERERAMNEALVSAQQLREDVREQAAREADLVIREARAEGERIMTEARQQLAAAAESLRRLHAQRARYLRLFRTMLERELQELDREEDRLAGGGAATGQGDTAGEWSVPAEVRPVPGWSGAPAPDGEA